MVAKLRTFKQNLDNAYALERIQEQARHIMVRLEVTMALYLRCKYRAKKRSTPMVKVKVKKDAPDATKVTVSIVNLRLQ